METIGSGARRSASGVLGSRPVAASWRLLQRGLRIVGYHEVRDPVAFEHQVRHLLTCYAPVSGAEVVRAVRDGAPLPRRAVWLTFDDGRRDVVEAGLEVLERHRVPATLFVCPGLVSTGAPLWTHRVRAAEAEAVVDGRRLRGAALVSTLKQVPDRRRRAVLAGIDLGPLDPTVASVDDGLLARWAASGREVGNHTWDHPCLDRCTPEEQEEQIVRAHDWLTERFGSPPELFAYPNGDRTEHAASLLAALGYGIAPLFDHAVAGTHQDRFALSRLRLDADAPLPRARAVLSGAHSAAFGLARRRSATRVGR